LYESDRLTRSAAALLERRRENASRNARRRNEISLSSERQQSRFRVVANGPQTDGPNLFRKSPTRQSNLWRRTNSRGASQVVRSQVRVIAAVERRSRRSGRRRTSIVDDDELGEDSARGVRIENGANESSERRANEPNCERATNATLNSIIRASVTRECLSRSNVRPQIRRENPPNLSILLGGGKEINEDFLSNGE
jgi:hypothetical protein